MCNFNNYIFVFVLIFLINQVLSVPSKYLKHKKVNKGKEYLDDYDFETDYDLIYDQRQNGTENYRLVIDGVVIGIPSNSGSNPALSALELLANELIYGDLDADDDNDHNDKYPPYVFESSTLSIEKEQNKTTVENTNSSSTLAPEKIFEITEVNEDKQEDEKTKQLDPININLAGNKKKSAGRRSKTKTNTQMVRLTKKEEQDKRELLSSLNHMNIDSLQEAEENDAFQHICEKSNHLISRTDDEERDIIFLKGLLDSPAVTQLIKIQDSFEELIEPEPVSLGNRELRREIAHRYSLSKNFYYRELSRLLNSPYIKSLIDVHDEIAETIIEYKKSPRRESYCIRVLDSPTNGMPSETIKMVGLRRNPKEPLGLTVEVDEHKQLMVARILAGGMIDRQGLLHPGDVILEVNGTPVSTPEELQNEILRANESVTLKIGPSLDKEMMSARITMSGGKVKHGKNLECGKKLTCYMRALFDYEPEYDTLLPCQDIGLPFKHGDILQIINVKDPNWWQAKHVDSNGPTGLIPSPELEERRKAYVPPEADFVHKIGICGTRISKKKRKTMYKSKANGEFDKADLMLYEEVTKMPPFKRKTLVLIGVQGVGRRTLKNRLINSDPNKFGTVIPHTTRPPRVLEENGQGYWFTDLETMDQEIKENKYLEYGEHNGNLYGTHMDSIKDIIAQGKMCVLDCAPSALKILHNSPEYMPFVIFIGAPGMETLKQIYAERRATGSSKNLAFDRQSSIRYSSRRARTLESLASLYEDDDLVSTVEESSLLQRKYEKYFDMIIINEDFDITFRKVVEALDQLSHEHQWVPVNWIY